MRFGKNERGKSVRNRIHKIFFIKRRRIASGLRGSKSQETIPHEACVTQSVTFVSEYPDETRDGLHLEMQKTTNWRC